MPTSWRRPEPAPGSDGDDQRDGEVVVDATGRGSHTPVWLTNLGFQPPAESEIEIGLGYTTWEFPRAADDLGGDIAAIIGATVDNPRFGAALACEGPQRQAHDRGVHDCTR